MNATPAKYSEFYLFPTFIRDFETLAGLVEWYKKYYELLDCWLERRNLLKTGSSSYTRLVPSQVSSINPRNASMVSWCAFRCLTCICQRDERRLTSVSAATARVSSDMTAIFRQQQHQMELLVECCGIYIPRLSSRQQKWYRECYHRVVSGCLIFFARVGHVKVRVEKMSKEL